MCEPIIHTMLKIAISIPWRDRGRWIWETLPPENYQADLLFCAPESDVKTLPPYIGELFYLWRRRLDFRQYDVLFGWELRSFLAMAILCQFIPKARRPPLVAVGPIIKGPLYRVLPLIRYFLRDTKRIICFSRAECESYEKLLRLPATHFTFLPSPWSSDEEICETEGGYILSLGHSNRDYPTLLKAVEGTHLPLILVAKDPAQLGGIIPGPNVTVKYNTGRDETIQLIHEATMHCIPLYDTQFSAGQTVLLRAMACGKATVISNTIGVKDYLKEGETAISVPPSDVLALRNALVALWNDPERRRRIGLAGAKTVKEEFGFPQFARHLVQIAEEISEGAS